MAGGRPKEFDEEEALELAMEFFWERGYRGAGVTELVRHVGIARQSLYNTFGNKRALFMRVIEHYRDTRLAGALEVLDRKGSALENVKEGVRFFEGLALDKRARGCLVANALLDVGPEDEEIGALLRGVLGLLEKGYHRALKRALTDGELGGGRDPRALARALTNASIGLAVTGRLGKGKREIEDISSGTVAMLG